LTIDWLGREAGSRKALVPRARMQRESERREAPEY
jgi:hypothetical protein